MIVKKLNDFNPLPKIKNKKHETEHVTTETYQAVYDRDKGRCQLCSSNKQIHLHHIYGRGKDLTNNVNNCILLCQKCHLDVVHKNLKKYRPFLNEIVQKKGDKNVK